MRKEAQEFWEKTLKETGKQPFQVGGETEKFHRELAYGKPERYRAAKRGWWKMGGEIHGGEGIFEPENVMKSSQFIPDDMTFLKKLIEENRNNPSWVYQLKDRIPLEANYSYGGNDFE